MSQSRTYLVYERFCVSLCALILAMLTQAAHGSISINSIRDLTPSKTYLVVVSVSSVAGNLAQLRYVDQEARLVFQTLTAPNTGFVDASDGSLLLGSKAERSAVLGVIEGYSNKLRPRDTLIIYWTGISGRDSQLNDVILYTADSTATSNYISVSNDLVKLADKNLASKFVLIADGCHVGNALVSSIQAEHPNISILASSKNDEVAIEGSQGSPFFFGFMTAVTSRESDLDGDGAISLEEAFVSLYGSVVRKAFGRQHPTLTGVSAHRVALAKVPQYELDFDEALPTDLLESDSVSINGREIKIDQRYSTTKKLVLLGEPAGIVSRGITYIEGIKSRILYWREDQALRKFEAPYVRSAAVLIAIDDYERKKDPLKRGSTGFESRAGMVEGARKVKDALVKNGFDRKDIIELYDSEATSDGIERTLRRFWQGSDLQGVDRLFIYFGGHGTTVAGNGILVTYDFDKMRPTQSGVLMRDLSGRQAENLFPRQVMVALDACASGLAVYRSLGDPPRVPVNEFQNLSVIRNDTAGKARNFLVAGTADQPALWDEGGIFTKALIAGLDGAADSNGDQIVQFLELVNYVANEVTNEASRKNVIQQVQSYELSALGNGKMLFFVPKTLRAKK